MKFLRHSLIILLFFLTAVPALAYRNIPALVHLNRAEQADTIGFNLVSSLCSLFYPMVMNEQLTLYVSPGKDLRMDPAALQSLETNSGTRFTECPDIFLHEYWSSNRKRTSFSIVGISFVNKNQLGEKVTFGFIDLREIDSLLRKLILPNTVNGSAYVNYSQALYSRRYAYHLVQLGTQTFAKAPVEAVRRKQEAFNAQKRIENLTTIPQQKTLSYQILSKKYSTDIDWSNDLIRAIRKVLELNPELYFNLGGNRYSAFPDTVFRIPPVTGLLIEELWVKEGRKPLLKSARIKVVLEGGDLEWMDMDDLLPYGIVIRYQSLQEILSEKPFEFDLIRINDQEVDPADGKRYLEALSRTSWNSISLYLHHADQ